MATQKFASLIDLLKNEPKIIVNKIYAAEQTSPWSCQAIFQALSPLSRILIFRLLFLHATFKLNDIYLMIGKGKDEDIDQVFDELLGLDILTEDVSNSVSKASNKSVPADLVDLTSNKPQNKPRKYQSDQTPYKMNPHFQKNLLRAITQPTDPWEDSGNHRTLKLSVSTDMIEEFRINQWNKVLSYLLGLVSENAFSASPLIPTFMKNFGLMMKAPTSVTTHHVSHALPTTTNNMVITAKGYEFLLKDYYHQVWDYVSIALTHVNKEENLSLLFMLSSTAFGQSYPMDSLTQSQRIFLFELSQVGIVYLPDSVHSKYFYPTKTIINLLFGMYNPSVLVGTSSSSLEKEQGGSGERMLNGSLVPSSSSIVPPGASISHLNTTTAASQGALEDHQHQLQIIVETNLQVTAYVTNDLHVALLQLFMDIHIRFANMAIGRITREKSIKAFKIGMKAAQMIDFLLIHAHPLTKQRPQIIPENVIDQLILWESELYRITPQESQLYDFSKLLQTKPQMYQQLVERLRALNLILWENPNQFYFIGDQAAEPIVQNFLHESYGKLF